VNPQPTTLHQILAPTVRIDWSQYEGMAALRCTVGVAIPLLIGLVLRQPSVSAFGAVGAVSVGFGSFQGAYRSRAALMLAAAAAMAISIFAGSLAGHSNAGTILIASLTALSVASWSPSDPRRHLLAFNRASPYSSPQDFHPTWAAPRALQPSSSPAV